MAALVKFSFLLCMGRTFSHCAEGKSYSQQYLKFCSPQFIKEWVWDHVRSGTLWKLNMCLSLTPVLKLLHLFGGHTWPLVLRVTPGGVCRTMNYQELSFLYAKHQSLMLFKIWTFYLGQLLKSTQRPEMQGWNVARAYQVCISALSIICLVSRLWTFARPLGFEL